MIDCATIKDLMPLYVDGVLSRESKALISGHLAECESCKQEFVNMQSEIAQINKLHHDDKGKIETLKSIKRKIFKQKVIVAMIASVLAVVIVISGFYGIFHYAAPIEYYDGFVRAKSSYLDLTLIFEKDFYSSNSISRIVNVNGTETEVKFIYVSETLYTRWFPNNRGDYAIRFGFAEGNVPMPIEVYYLIAPFGEWIMSDEDFYAQKNDAVLIWSGTLE